MDQFPCPKCNRLLARSGEAEVDGALVPIFQCDECVVETTMFGESVEVAFTFAVNAEGEPFDPATEDGELPI